MGILQVLPAEVRIMIYNWVFLEAQPRVEISIEHDSDSNDILDRRVTYYGDELLHASRGICEEAVLEYWTHVSTISASRTFPVSSCIDITIAGGQANEPLPLDLSILAKALPQWAKDNVLHLRNVSFLPQHQSTDEKVERLDVTQLLQGFKKLETVVFNEYRNGTTYHPWWSLRSRGPMVTPNQHSDFGVYHSTTSPQQWLKERYGLDVIEDPSVSNIHFLKKAIEKRSEVWELYWRPRALLGGDGELVPPREAPPLSVCA